MRFSALVRLLLAIVPLAIAGVPAAHADDALAVADASASEAAPLLFLVDGPSRLWIYGTLHTNDPRVLARPALVENAFAASDAFFAETALDGEPWKDLVAAAALPAGDTLSALLPDGLRERLIHRLDTLGHSLATYEGLAPWVLWFTLEAAVQGESTGEGPPLDTRLYRDAVRRGKTVGGLECAEEQIAPFAALDLPRQLDLVVRSLDALDRADAAASAAPLEAITRAWLAGDEHEVLALTARFSGRGDALDAYLVARLLDARSERMADRLAALVRRDRGRTLFAAIGAAHLAGPGGVLARLEARGLSARRITTAAEAGSAARAAPPSPRPSPPPRPCRRRPRCGPFGLPLPPLFR